MYVCVCIYMCLVYIFICVYAHIHIHSSVCVYACIYQPSLRCVPDTSAPIEYSQRCPSRRRKAVMKVQHQPAPWHCTFGMQKPQKFGATSPWFLLIFLLVDISAGFKQWKLLPRFSPLTEIEPDLYALCVLYCLNTFLHLFPAWNIKEILEVLVCTDCTFNALFYILPLKHPWILNNTLLPCCHSLHVQINKIFWTCIKVVWCSLIEMLLKVFMSIQM